MHVSRDYSAAGINSSPKLWPHGFAVWILLPMATVVAMVLTALPLAASSAKTNHSAQTSSSAQSQADYRVIVDKVTRTLLESLLTEEQLARTLETFSHQEAWGSLGPAVGASIEPTNRPEQRIDLPIPSAGQLQGTGTANDPFLFVISEFLETFHFERKTLRVPQHGYPEDDVIENYLASLPYQPATVILPAGHYVEYALDVPPGIWLEGKGNATISPALRRDESQSTLVHLNIGAGFVNVTLDGSNILDFKPEPPVRIDAIQAAHRATVHRSHIRHFTGNGIRAAGTRGREGSDVTVTNSIIEHIGYSGIRGQSGWFIADNRIRYAGLLRSTGGGGDDGIIPAWGADGSILNNLVIMKRAPYGRHAISGQAAHGYFIAGNIAIVEGTIRNTIGFSDASHRNTFSSNLSLVTNQSESRIHAGLSASGCGNIILFNVAIGNPHAYRVRCSDHSMNAGEAPSALRHNFGLFTLSGIHRSQNFNAEHNLLYSYDRPSYPALDEVSTALNTYWESLPKP